MRIKKSRQGFTLIEIILVILVMSVIIGISAPNFTGTYASLQLKKTVDDLSYLMRYAQSRAITKNLNMRIEFDSSFSEYRILEESSSGDFSSFSGRMARKQTVPSKIKINSSDTSIDFMPDGNIEKQKFEVCHEKKCFIISTEEQRGYVNVYEEG